MDDLLSEGYIKCSVSSWEALVLLTNKKDDTKRLNIDYRSLNKVTVKNYYSLLRIDDLLNKLDRAEVFLKIDVHLEYHW